MKAELEPTTCILRVDKRFLEMLPAGTPDFANAEYFSQFGYMKLTPTVACEVNEKISIAGSPQLGYSTIRMKMPFFMDQSGNGVPDTLFAADMDGNSLSIGAKIGALYHFSERVGFGVSYSTPVGIDIEGETTMVAPVAQMGGMIPAQAREEGDLEIDIGWPQSVKVGVFWKMGFLGGTVVAFDVERLDWSHYFDSISVRLKNVRMNGVLQPDKEFTMDLKKMLQ